MDDATQNNFGEIDLNKPPRTPYVFKEFPKTVYHHGNGRVHTVANEKELKAAQRAGFETKPSADYDYSKTVKGLAPKKPAPSPEDQPIKLDLEEEST